MALGEVVDFNYRSGDLLRFADSRFTTIPEQYPRAEDLLERPFRSRDPHKHSVKTGRQAAHPKQPAAREVTIFVLVRPPICS